MSSVDRALQAFRKLEPEDFKVLSAIEFNMSRHRNVPRDIISGSAQLPEKETDYRIRRLNLFGLIYGQLGSYAGYAVSIAGYDCLAMNALVKENTIEALGKPLGVGKESDVYDALTPTQERVAAKFHRLGRVSFRQTRRLRGYLRSRRRTSWLYQSRLAAEREFEALKLVHPYGVRVPAPISQNRHVVVMGMIEGARLVDLPEVPEPEKVLDEIVLNVRKTYLEAGVVHGDLSEFNIILKPDRHIMVIDWPQFVRKDHYSAEQLLQRDVGNVLRFFERKYKVRRDSADALRFAKGKE